MGDRCDLKITYRRADEKEFAEVLGPDWWNMVEDEDPTYRTVYMEQVNYGMLRERQDLAAKGLCFLGEHGSGGDYCAARFVALDGDHVDVASCEGELVVFLDDEGRVTPRTLKAARRYLRLAEKARRLLGLDMQTKPE